MSPSTPRYIGRPLPTSSTCRRSAVDSRPPPDPGVSRVSVWASLKAPVAHACIPLKFEGETKGVLNVAARPGEQFSEEQLRFLETLGHQVGLAVERARHRQSERRRHREAQAMAAIDRAIGGSLDIQSILAAVGDTAPDILPVDRVVVLLGSDPRSLRVGHLAGHPRRPGLGPRG